MQTGKSILLFAVFVGCVVLGLGQSREGWYGKEWEVIDSLILKKDLTRTALSRVNQLYTRARQEKKNEQALKALLYQNSLEDRVNTDDPARNIKATEAEISKTTDVVQKAILHSLLARQYLQYYRSRMWILAGRKNTTGVKKDDIATWTADDFLSAARDHFIESLKPAAQLKLKKNAAYQAVIIAGTESSLRPTIFDLLAHTAIDFFKAGERASSSARINLPFEDSVLLMPMNRFINHHLSKPDTTDNRILALDIFQQLLLFHLADDNKNALVDADVERIDWVYQQSGFIQKERLRKQALQYLVEQYQQTAATAGALYAMARSEADLASQFQPFGDTSHRYAYINALQLVQQAQALFPTGMYSASLYNLANEIRQQFLSFEMERINIPNQPILANIKYRNCDSLFVRVLRLNSDDALLRSFAGTHAAWRAVNSRKPTKTFTQKLPASEDHQQHTAQVKIDGLTPGHYALYASNHSDFSDSTDNLTLQFLDVSGLSYVQYDKTIFVLDRNTGQPVNGAEVVYQQMLFSSFKTVATRKTDENGSVRFNTGDGSWRYIFRIPGDTLSNENGDYVYNNRIGKNNSLYEQQNNRIFFFLDRSIYRPGQTVYFKGIGVTRDSLTHQNKLIASKKAGWLYLRDANNRLIDSMKFELNDFGSFHGEFQLPQNVLTGNFRLEATSFNQASGYFSVEEYKRPNFSVTIKRPTESYRLNDTVTVTGNVKAYAGNPVGGAKVQYDITRNTWFAEPFYFRRIRPIAQNKSISHGEIVTDAQGNFKLKFVASAGDITDSTGNPMFDFTVNTTVTDISGETRTGSVKITTGFQSMLLNVRTPATLVKDSVLKMSISTTNLSNEKQPAIVSISILRLQTPQAPIRQRLLSRPDQFLMSKEIFQRYFPEDEYDNESAVAGWPVLNEVQHTIINTEEKDSWLLEGGSLAAGTYRIEAATTDKYGRKIRQTSFVEVMDPATNMLAYPSILAKTEDQKTAQPGEQVNFLSGSDAPDRFVIRQTGITDTANFSFHHKKAGISDVQYPVTEKDRGGTVIQEFFVYHNRAYSKQYQVGVPWTNKQLQVSYTSYRDHTEPGSAETWTVTVAGEKSNGRAAELLTAMYDASLDQFKQHSWQQPAIWVPRFQQNQFRWSNAFTLAYAGYRNEPSWNWRDEPYMYDRIAMEAEEFWPEQKKRSFIVQESALSKEALYDQVVTVGAGNKRYDAAPASSQIRIRGTASVANTSTVIVDGKPVANIDNIDANNILSTEMSADGTIIITTKNAPAPVQVRKNLNETAFFFPQLYADSTGKFSFSFTMPEALTQWKWMAFAHTKDLAFGVNSTTIVTQKKLMVQPNAPRFMREGDNIEFSGKIVNMTDKEISGQVSLELIDATTNTSVDGWFQNVFPSQYFTAEAGKSIAVKFPLQVPFSFNRPLTWRLVARAGEASDGEENTLPVLPNRMLVTESLPLYLPNDSARQFSFEKLLYNNSESLTTESLTVEYTSNPVWYAVQALPYLMEYPYECSEQIFNRLYANTLASFIINRQPALKRVFELWKKDSTALLSKLQKNEELKQVLLQETPWVLQAVSEAQQKKNLALLFDMAKLNEQTDQFIQKLEQMQLPDGSFSWFKGGHSDRFITNYVLTGIGKLKRLGALTPDVALRIRNILTRAIQFMDAKNGEDYELILLRKADLNKQQIGYWQIEYLYMRSFFADIAQGNKTAFDYYYKQAMQFWIKQNSYHKAEIGLIAFRNHDEAFAAKTIAPALVENASSNTKLGMYWKTAYTNWWYQSPVEHQSMMINFFSELNIGKTDAASMQQINEMKTWLLLNKQTSHWGTTIATADACYALLLQGSSWLDSDKKITIQLGNTTISGANEKNEAGTGYFKKRIDGKLVTPQMGNIQVSVSGSGNAAPSWGSVHWQYFEDLDKITGAAGPLSVVKKLFIEKNTDNGKLLVAVNDGDELKVGDKLVVRLELRSDRDMDYLQLKDMRAASTEPVNVLSGYKWQDGLGYYESTRDAATNFFIDHLRKGTYVFDYPLFVTHSGIFSVGVASIQSMYAPEFNSHSAGIKIRVVMSDLNEGESKNK